MLWEKDDIDPGLHSSTHVTVNMLGEVGRCRRVGRSGEWGL